MILIYNLKDNIIFQILVCIIIAIILIWFQISNFENIVLKFFFDNKINTINLI